MATSRSRGLRSPWIRWLLIGACVALCLTLYGSWTALERGQGGGPSESVQDGTSASHLSERESSSAEPPSSSVLEANRELKRELAELRASIASQNAELKQLRATSVPEPAARPKGAELASSALDSARTLEYDAHFVRAAKDFELNEDYDIRRTLVRASKDFALPETMQHAWNEGFTRLELLSLMARGYMSPTHTTQENKLYNNQVYHALGMPVQKLYYAATTAKFATLSTKANLEFNVPAYDRKLFLSVAMKHLNTTGWVLKPLTGGDSRGILIMTAQRWVKELWTENSLADFIEKNFIRAAYSGKQQVHIIDASKEISIEFAPLGFMMVRKYDTPENCNVDEHFRPGICKWSEHMMIARKCQTRCLPFEIRCYVIFGHMYNCVSYGRSAAYDNAFHLYADGKYGYQRGKENIDLFQPAQERDTVVSIALESLPQLIQQSEKIGTLIGADYVRVDWFLGGKGMELNEVTYQGHALTGLPGRERWGELHIEDAGPRHARILNEVYKLQEFNTVSRDKVLSRLGCFYVKDFQRVPVHCRLSAPFLEQSDEQWKTYQQKAKMLRTKGKKKGTEKVQWMPNMTKFLEKQKESGQKLWQAAQQVLSVDQVLQLVSLVDEHDHAAFVNKMGGA